MIKGALLHLRSFPAVARIPVQFISGILALGSGLSLGREGPTVQIGAALGEHYARAHQLSPRSRDNLIACGAGAGLAAAFHAPLAGLLFVIEELHRRLSPIAFGTTIVAVFTADLVNRLTFKQSPSYLLLLYPAPSLATLPLIIIVGVTAGAAGVLFNRTLLASATLGRDIDAKYPLAIPIVTSVVVAAALLFLPETGYNDPAAALRWLLGEFHTDDSILLLLALLGAKFLLTILSFLCRVPGGIITPILAIGGFLGLTIGVMAQRAAPALIPFPGVFGLIGMASLFTAVVRAPLTGIVLILEMTSNHAMLLALVTGTVAAYLTAEHLGDKPIYDALLLEEVVLRGAEGNRTAPPSDAREWPTPPPQANGGSIRELEGEGSTV
jgi:CIC family chloride channel protein